MALGIVLALAACSDATPDNKTSVPPSLEAAAIERGLVRDPGGDDRGGLYARDSDRVCLVADGDAYRIGAFVDYGDGIACAASGTAIAGEGGLRVTFGGEDCAFDAVQDGDRIAFPGRLPEGCKRFCRSRASLAALDVERLSDSVSEATALRDSRGRALCGNGGV